MPCCIDSELPSAARREQVPQSSKCHSGRSSSRLAQVRVIIQAACYYACLWYCHHTTSNVNRSSSCESSTPSEQSESTARPQLDQRLARSCRCRVTRVTRFPTLGAQLEGVNLMMAMDICAFGPVAVQETSTVLGLSETENEVTFKDANLKSLHREC